MKQHITLKTILPTIGKNIRYGMDLNIGDNEADCGTNYYDLDDDNWSISFEFDLWMSGCGSKGKVYDLRVEHYDDETDEETVFSESEIRSFREDLESILRDLA